MRLIRSQQDQITRSSEVVFTFDDTPVTAYSGETVSVALLRNGIRNLRSNARGMFCCMGLCQECMVLIDEGSVEACRVPVTEGLTVQSLDRRR